MSTVDEHAWYVFSTESRKEHQAEAMIQKTIGLPTLLPKRRIQVSRIRQITETVFPGYIFVNCNLTMHLRWISSVHGVRAVVKFGGCIPSVPCTVIDYLRESVHDDDPSADCVELGKQVEIVAGPFSGFVGVISGLRSARARVEVLLDFLSSRVKVVVTDAAIRVLDHQSSSSTAGHCGQLVAEFRG